MNEVNSLEMAAEAYDRMMKTPTGARAFLIYFFVAVFAISTA